MYNEPIADKQLLVLRGTLGLSVEIYLLLERYGKPYNGAHEEDEPQKGR